MTNPNHSERVCELLVHEQDRYLRRAQDFYHYLQTESSTGFTARQFDIYRANFFYRTHTTALSIARALRAAELNADHLTADVLRTNLADEFGVGCGNVTHAQLLERSHIAHGQRVFGLPPTTFARACTSGMVLPEALTFRRVQRDLLTSSRYAVVLGATYAQEWAANAMLQAFYSSFFMPYRDFYSDRDDWSQVAEYFEVHLCGTELRHARDAHTAILRAGSNARETRGLIEGIRQFLDLQLHLWCGLLLSLAKAKSNDACEVIGPRAAISRKGMCT